MHPVELIFINWNSADLLFAAAATLDQTKMPYRICVVDNGSADDSCAQIRARLPDARLIEMGYNSGFATAVNAGLNAAEGRYALILNTDIEFQNDVPALLIEALQSFDDALACPELRRPDGTLQAAVVPEPRKESRTKSPGFVAMCRTVFSRRSGFGVEKTSWP